MQAALFFVPTLPLTPTKTSPSWRSSPTQHKLLLPQIKATASAEPSTVDYSSTISVFPAEACETLGGDACAANMFPEVKLKSEASTANTRALKEELDRDYLEYSEPKTVFPGEACDDLGGEFCEPDYQQGVYQEKS